MKLQSYGLTVLDVQAAIQNQNVQVASAQLGAASVLSDQIFQFTVLTLGRVSDVAQFENIVVKARPPAGQAAQLAKLTPTGETAAIVRLKDLARIELSQQTYNTFSGLSGRKAAQIKVYTLPGANALKVAEGVRKAMAQMREKFPPGLEYTALVDTSAFISDSIHGVCLAH